jgi:DNA-binding transcriptional regulator GbsR (MarR family)
MPEDTPTPDLSSQFRELGENLKSLLRATWEHKETQKLRRDLQRGLDELGEAVSETLEEIQQSEAARKVQAEAEEIKASIERGEIEAKARADIAKALNFLNAELGKLNRKMSSEGEAEDEDNEGD